MAQAQQHQDLFGRETLTAVVIKAVADTAGCMVNGHVGEHLGPDNLGAAGCLDNLTQGIGY